MYHPKLIEFIAFAGGLWFFISQMSLGFFVQKYARESHAIELEEAGKSLKVNKKGISKRKGSAQTEMIRY